MAKFHGVYPALITPVTEGNKVNVEVLEQLTEIILRLSEYMIEEEYLIFESSHIYIDRNGDLRCVFDGFSFARI